MVLVSMKSLAFSAVKIDPASSRFSSEWVVWKWSKAMWKRGRSRRWLSPTRATSSSGVMPSPSALSMIGAPCASSALTKVHLVPLQAHEAHPDVGLDVLHDVPDVERAVGVGKRGGDEKLAGHEVGRAVLRFGGRWSRLDERARRGWESLVTL